ncbi:MAG: aminopeptidase P family protein [Magnetococcales bacterium]|nr:aminopeptidase P family protein [Magnetococcales bacterium]
MTARIIYADSERSADMLYATGLFAPDPFLYVQEESGRSHLVISILELDRARRVAQVDQVVNWEEVRRAFKEKYPDEIPQAGSLAAFFLRDLEISSVQAPDDFPLGFADRLRQNGIEVNAVEGAFWPERAIKRPQEIAAIETALVKTGIGMAAGIDMISQSRIGEDGLLHLDGEILTSERVRATINKALVDEGASGFHTIVSGGDQAADPHEEGFGPLPAHRAIILDVFPRVEKSGYWGDMTRTICRGKVPERVQKAYDAVWAGQKLAFSMIQEGVSGLTVHQAVTDLMTEAGFPTGVGADGRQQGFFHGTGHGLGLEVHEFPRVGRKDEILQAGHVVTVEPGLYYPDMGGVRLEDVVVVEKEGCRNLTDVPKVLEV